jgi:alpha-1,6-mannosyltransferase
LQTPGTVRSWLSLPTALALSLAALLRAVGAGNHTDGLIASLRLVGALTAAGVGAVLLAAGRRPVVQATALTLLTGALLGPADQPWYLLWGGILLAAAPLSKRTVTWLAATSIGLCVYTLTAMALGTVGRTGQLILTATCLATGILLLVRRNIHSRSRRSSGQTRTSTPALEDADPRTC